MRLQLCKDFLQYSVRDTWPGHTVDKRDGAHRALLVWRKIGQGIRSLAGEFKRFSADCTALEEFGGADESAVRTPSLLLGMGVWSSRTKIRYLTTAVWL